MTEIESPSSARPLEANSRTTSFATEERNRSRSDGAARSVEAAEREETRKAAVRFRDEPAEPCYREPLLGEHTEEGLKQAAAQPIDP